MKIYTRQIGGYGGGSAKIIELTVEGFSSFLTEDVTDLRGKVDENLIQSLREIADELEEHNTELREYLKPQPK